MLFKLATFSNIHCVKFFWGLPFHLLESFRKTKFYFFAFEKEVIDNGVQLSVLVERSEMHCNTLVVILVNSP